MGQELSDLLLFSKEAAEFLEISPQRLNALVKEGKIKPLKKNASGTIFHLDELKKRKEEQDIFAGPKQKMKNGFYSLETRVEREALNFATLMNALKMTEQKLEPLFSSFEEKVDVSTLLGEKQSLLQDYSRYFKVSIEELKSQFDFALRAFSRLRTTDEIIKRGSEDYPPLLAKTEQAPRFLYVRGNKSLLFEKRTVALVGSRQASDKAKQNTRRLAIALGRNGITIISGLARGIDVTAHKAALDNGLNTIAVIGTNLNQYYPMENKPVQKAIEEKGLVISQFSPASKTERWFFPLRNGVMSGLSLATVIMEAGETSGALKQADFAIKQKRDVLIPKKALEIQSITWPAKYLKKGAKLVESPKDVLEILADSDIFKPEVSLEREQESFESLLESLSLDCYV